MKQETVSENIILSDRKFTVLDTVEQDTTISTVDQVTTTDTVD